MQSNFTFSSSYSRESRKYFFYCSGYLFHSEGFHNASVHLCGKPGDSMGFPSSSSLYRGWGQTFQWVLYYSCETETCEQRGGKSRQCLPNERVIIDNKKPFVVVDLWHVVHVVQYRQQFRTVTCTNAQHSQPAVYASRNILAGFWQSLLLAIQAWTNSVKDMSSDDCGGVEWP